MKENIYNNKQIDGMSDCKSILESFVMNNNDLEELEDRLSEFNLFEAIGAVRRELRHSDFLSFLLNPTESHNLGGYPLKLMLKDVVKKSDESRISVIDIDISDLKDVEVYREWRKIDILIVSSETKLVFAIENKVDTGEHSNQLDRYQAIIDEQYSGYNKLFAYLTPFGDPASNNMWVSLSYTEIHDIISRTANTAKTTIGADVLTLLQHYCAMLRRHIMTENEIAVLCQKIYKKHRKALDLIFEHRPDELNDIHDYLINLISNVEEFVLDNSPKTYIRFAPVAWDKLPDQFLGDGWTKSKRILLFEFTNWNGGLKLGLLVGPGDADARERLFSKTEGHPSVFKGRRPVLTKMYTQVFKTTVLTKTDIENSELEQLFEKIDKRWEKFLTTDYPKIAEIIS